METYLIYNSDGKGLEEAKLAEMAQSDRPREFMYWRDRQDCLVMVGNLVQLYQGLYEGTDMHRHVRVTIRYTERRWVILFTNEERPERRYIHRPHPVSAGGVEDEDWPRVGAASVRSGAVVRPQVDEPPTDPHGTYGQKRRLWSNRSPAAKRLTHFIDFALGVWMLVLVCAATAMLIVNWGQTGADILMIAAFVIVVFAIINPIVVRVTSAKSGPFAAWDIWLTDFCMLWGLGYFLWGVVFHILSKGG